jgi:hypothetical protein
MRHRGPERRQRVRYRPGASRLVLLGLVAILVGLVTAPSGATVGSSPAALRSFGAPPGPAPLDANTTANLEMNSTGFPVSPYFWGTTVSGKARLLPQEGSLVNSTPTEIVVWPGGNTGDVYDPITNTIYDTSKKDLGQPVCHTVQNSHPPRVTCAPPTNESQFVSWCQSINCAAIMQVPGEINNTTLAVQIVKYTENTLGFCPEYWEVGNEPELWTRFNLPWNEWSTSRDHPVTPIEYAWEVRNFSLAMNYPGNPCPFRMIGIPATGGTQGGTSFQVWFDAMVEVDGSGLSALSFHQYPAGKGTNVGPWTLQQFYGYLNGPTGLATRVEDGRAWIRAAALNSSCGPACESIPVFVTEIGSALSHQHYGQFSANFPGALSLAAQLAEGLNLNVSNIDLYGSIMNTTNSWFSLSGSPRPDYVAYSQVFSHLGTTVYPVNVSGLNNSVYGVATLAPGGGDRADLMVVNTNMTASATFVPQLPGQFPESTPIEVYEWNGSELDGTTNGTTWVEPATPAPVAHYFPGGWLQALSSAGTWTLPPQSLVLFEAYPHGGTPVTFTESGLPSGTRWFLSVNGTQTTSLTDLATFYLSTGSYGVSVASIPLPLGTQRTNVTERYAASVESPLAVGTAPLQVPVPFVEQYALSLIVEPAGAGTVTPSPAWVTAGDPITLRAQAESGYVFTHWVGYGAGSYNGSSANATLVPASRISEKAFFSPGFLVGFTESGLPGGTNWSITLTGPNTTYSSVTSEISFVSRDGVFGFHVNKVPGYHSNVTNSSFSVAGRGASVLVGFYRPPPPNYTVVLTEAGLTPGTAWTVTVRNATVRSTTSSMDFSEPNGTYGYQVAPLAGFRATPPNSSFTVSGGPTYVTVRYAALYVVEFVQSGLPTGTPWSVALRDGNHSATTPTISVEESNGSYGLRVSSSNGYRVSYPWSGFVVNGSSLRIDVNYTRLQTAWAVHWVESGLWSGATWWVVVGSDPVFGNGSWITLPLGNGTYTFAVFDSSSFLPRPSSGTIHVAAANLTLIDDINPRGSPVAAVHIVFSMPPSPSAWSLGFRATVVGGAIALSGWGSFALIAKVGHLRRRDRAGDSTHPNESAPS